MRDRHCEGNSSPGVACAAKEIDASEIAMTPLRRKLEIAKASHHADRYVGDLAADAFESSPTSRTTFWRSASAGVAIVSALAAMIAMVIWMNQPARTPTRQVAMTTSPAVPVDNP